jgi:hypothetical protein
MKKNTKIIIFGLLIVLGVVLLGYGAFIHSTNVTAQQEDTSVTVAKSEPALVKEVTVGGVTREESGQIKQTYTGEAPKACPT